MWAYIAATVASAVVSAKGAEQQGQAANAAAQYQAQVANNNAVIANQNADYAVRAGQAKGQQESMKGAANLGRLRAAQAANGIDINSGSDVDVQAGQAEVNQLNTENVIQNADLTAYGYRSQSGNFTAQSGLDTAEGENAEQAGQTAALGSLLEGASSVGGAYAKGKAP